MMRRSPRPLRYAVAVAACGLTFVARDAMTSFIFRPLVIVFVLPILVSAYLGGLGPGLLATALSVLAAVWFQPARFALGFATPADVVQCVLLLVVGVTVSLLNHALHRAFRREEEALRAASELRVRQGQAEERRAAARRLEGFVRDAPIGVVLGGADGSIHFANDEYLRLVGSTREEFDARQVRWDDITPPEWLEADRAAIAALQTRRVVRYEKEYLRRDGSRVPVHIGLIRQEDALAAFVLDITEQRRAVRALEEADRRKDEFLAVLSHELRNPLAPVRNATHLLAVGTPAAAARSREIIARQVQHLARLVDDLLDVTRIGRGRIELQRAPLDLGALVRHAVEDHRALFASRDVALRHEPPSEPLTVVGDGVRLAQVVGNLLHNAAKFTPAGRGVTVAARREGEEALVEVRDEGAGIAPELLPRIFDPFVQADGGLSRAQGGLGLGLPLARGLVELHGGTVEALSAGAGLGATFRVRLPLAPAAAAGAPAAVALATTPRKVLVVEDNLDSAETLRMMLELEGHAVQVAYDGRDGLARARAFGPDVILCDIGLPELDGYAVARRVRADPALASVRLVALTGYALPEDQRRAAEAGFDLHLAKPPTVDQIHAAVAGATAG